ncbi:MAG: DUF2149 domain-containing protein [Bacteroidetes bacterium]|nr:DUF2149 domain-containing protein [Bacteroidota bacterium]
MRRNRFNESDDESVNPMLSVANLFDVAIVFALALMVALVVRFQMDEIFSKEDYTIVKNPGKSNMEIIKKTGKQIERFKASNDAKTNKQKGKRLGVAYELEDGEIIYIPE